MEKSKEQKVLEEEYEKKVKEYTPTHCLGKEMAKAFLVGGIICCIGQGFRYLLQYAVGLEGDELSAYVSMIMVFLGAFLTGLGVYDRIGKFAGGGSIVPITGFANSVVSPAIEFKTEGFIYGTAAKMFVVAGPIIVFGIASSVLVGLLYFIGFRIF